MSEKFFQRNEKKKSLNLLFYVKTGSCKWEFIFLNIGIKWKEKNIAMPWQCQKSRTTTPVLWPGELWSAGTITNATCYLHVMAISHLYLLVYAI